jgi:hypothetical protein
MKITELLEDSSDTMTFWHGGRNLQFNHMEMLGAKHGRWEYGPGLYLTNHYETARKYAKGGGSTYKVTVEKGTDIKQITIDLKEVIDFVKRYVIGKHRSNIIDDLKNNLNKLGILQLEVLVNLCVNYDALSPKNTVELRKFLVNHGADYEIVRGYGGRDEHIAIIFNPTKIKNIEPIKASDVTLDQWKLLINK